MNARKLSTSLTSRSAGKSILMLFFAFLPTLAILTFAIFAAGPAAGFSLDDNLDNGTPFNDSDDLLDAARWSNLPGSYVDNGVRGLGSGLEYSIASNLCADLIPQFIDSPSCEEIRLSIQNTFDIWTKDHPAIRFVDVSNNVAAALPPHWVAEPWRGFGAEIDILALDPDQFSPVKGSAAWTNFWYSFTNPIGTNGHVLSGNSITSADIVINPRASFYLDPAQAVDGSNDFAALMLHEIGHTFGLGHPSHEDSVNFDNDSDPYNVMSIDCESPEKGLVVSSPANPHSVMNPDLPVHGTNQLELSNDELGALRFLYPVC